MKGEQGETRGNNGEQWGTRGTREQGWTRGNKEYVLENRRGELFFESFRFTVSKTSAGASMIFAVKMNNLVKKNHNKILGFLTDTDLYPQYKIRLILSISIPERLVIVYSVLKGFGGAVGLHCYSN